MCNQKSIYLLMVLISTSDTLYAKPLSTFLVQMVIAIIFF